MCVSVSFPSADGKFRKDTKGICSSVSPGPHVGMAHHMCSRRVCWINGLLPLIPEYDPRKIKQLLKKWKVWLSGIHVNSHSYD